MPALEKTKYETFARNLARGMTQEEAYEQAGFSRSRSAAARLANNPLILERVEEIKKERERLLTAPVVHDEDDENDHGEPLIEVTPTWVIERLAANVVSAQSVGNHSAANKALEMLGHHLGMSFSDKKPGSDDGDKAAGLGSGNTFNILQMTDRLLEHGNAIEHKPMKDVTPEAEADGV